MDYEWTQGARRGFPLQPDHGDKMKSRMSLLLLPLLLGAAVSTADSREKDRANPRPVVLVEWNSSQSLERLARSSNKSDFFPLSNHFVSQNNKIFCGLASASIVLNALRLGRKTGLPQDRQSIAEDELAWLPRGFNPFFGKYTPNNVLNARTKSRIEVLGKPIEIEGVLKKDYGLQLRQLARVLRSHGLDVATRVVNNEADAGAIKREIVANLASGDDFVLVNYARKSLGQKGGGHISPLGAYDKRSDSFLVMDVNPNSAPWVWVRSDDLIRAMRTFDTVENRGYLLISDKAR